MSEPKIPSPPEHLETLLQVRDRLFTREVFDRVKRLSKEERQQFVSQRMKLSEEVLRLEAARLSELREALEHHGAELDRSARDLTESLADLEDAAQWAQGIGKLLSVVSLVVPAI